MVSYRPTKGSLAARCFTELAKGIQMSAPPQIPEEVIDSQSASSDPRQWNAVPSKYPVHAGLGTLMHDTLSINARKSLAQRRPLSRQVLRYPSARVVPIGRIFALAALIPTFAVTARRLRDTGKSRCYFLLGRIPERLPRSWCPSTHSPCPTML